MFDRVLIANRGEIARRVIRTCRRLGVESVAVFSDADRDAPFAKEADQALRIGPAPARESYLRVSAIIEAARQSGAQAIHPGYGFLSENPELARACESEDLVFIGPPASVVERMGSKIEAKLLAASAGVPVIPGFEGDNDDRRLLDAAQSVGFPLLVKASAGGGGKGMRLIETPAELPAGIEIARREALAAFGDDRLLLERFVRRARHVEVQVVADNHGSVLSLFDRDCSLQRNNQKVFEEAPAPDLPEQVRARLRDDAVHLARTIGYRSVGTMEFLLDVNTDEHFFLEMNTRLQVEHTVTEEITGLDLVEWQLRIAAGETLPLTQAQISIRGHAIEARLLAERPEAGYLPSSGPISLWRARHREGVRLDSGVETGSEVPIHYDSMIAKVIAYGPDREIARLRLIRALRDLVVLGPETNRAFLIDVASDSVFVTASGTTASLKEMFAVGWTRPALPQDQADHLVAALSLAWRIKPEGQASPWSTLNGFRLLEGAGRTAIHTFLVSSGGESREAAVRITAGVIYAGLEPQAQRLDIEHCGSTLEFRYGEGSSPGVAVIEGDQVLFRLGAVEHKATARMLVDAVSVDVAAGSTDGDELAASMPGIVAELHVVAGQQISKSDPLVTLESMKLFMTLRASRDGVVSVVHVQSGDTIAAGARLVSFEPVQDNSNVTNTEESH